MSFMRAGLLAVLVSACAGRPGGLPVSVAAPLPQPALPRTPRYYTAHFDHVQPDRLRQFEQARHVWLTILARERTSDQRGTFFQVDSDTILTVRGFDAFTELDARGPSRARALAGIAKSDVERYDNDSDGALAPPHRSEIWAHLESLDYRPSGSLLTLESAPCARMVVEVLNPAPVGGGAPYDDAWTSIQAALVTAAYPLPRVTFHSVYGSGAIVSFWLATDPDQLSQAPTVDEVVVSVLGREPAEAAFRRRTAGIFRTDTHTVRLRSDLTRP
jgi:hypothetical protein